MSSQDHDEGGVSFGLPPAVDDWLAAEATRRNESRDDACRRLVTAAHAVATDDDLEVADRDDLEAVRGKLEAQREEFTGLLEDVRARVVQVKRETDGKAAADHDHSRYASADDLAAVRDGLAALEDAVDRGFGNYETVLEDLLDETGELADRSTLLAKAVVDLRDRRDALADRQRRRAAADELRLAANRLGIRTATCADCDSSVDLALLSAPECPHCASRFTDVAEKSSLFGSHRLLTGEPPAIEGRVEPPVDSTTDAVFEAAEADAEPIPPDRDDGAEDDATRSAGSAGDDR